MSKAAVEQVPKHRLLLEDQSTTGYGEAQLEKRTGFVKADILVLLRDGVSCVVQAGVGLAR